MLAAARAAGLPVSVDPSSAAPLRRAGAAAFLGWIAGAALLLPNRDEAAALSGHADPERAARALAAHAREVVVKLGAEGALWTDGGAAVRGAGAVGAGRRHARARATRSPPACSPRGWPAPRPRRRCARAARSPPRPWAGPAAAEARGA